jgi:hypothetical protein
MAGEMPDAGGKTRAVDSSSSYGYPPSAPPQPQHQQYGTFGPPSASGEFPQPAVGYPQPAPPHGLQHYPTPPPASYAVYPPPQQQPYSAAPTYYARGYQAVQGSIRLYELCASVLLVILIRLVHGRRSFVGGFCSCCWFSTTDEPVWNSGLDSRVNLPCTWSWKTYRVLGIFI